MKILYVGHTYTVSANHAKIRALAQLPDVEIALITPQGWRGPLYVNSTDRLTDVSNVKHHIVKAFGLGKEGAYFYHPSLAKIVRAFQPDIIHVEQGAYALSYIQILLIARRWVPAARAVFFTWWNLPYTAGGIKSVAERYNLAHSAGAIAGNREAADILRDHGFDGAITVLPQLGVDLAADIAPRRRVASASLHVGYVGRIEPEKGVGDLLEAVLGSEADMHLSFVGAGSVLEQLKARSHGLANIAFFPAIRNEKVPEYLTELDVLVLPSRSTPQWVEQFGHILIEAMAMGVTVVGSTSGEIPNVIGDAGRIFPEGDVESLRRTLEGLATNEDERLALASAAIARVRERFTNDVIARRQFDFYKLVLREGRSVSDGLEYSDRPKEEFSLV